MRIVNEPASATDIDALGAAWSSVDSVLVLPKVSPVGKDWLTRTLAGLPPDLRVDHIGLLTSGSTGEPKLVIGSKARATQLATVIHARQQLEGVRSTVLALPLSYSYSFVNQWLWARTHGAECVFTRGLSQAGEFIDALTAALAPSMMCLVGSQIPLLRRSLAAGRSFPSVSRLNFAGGAFPQDALLWLASVFPNAQVFNNYGCTEALPRLCIRAADESSEATAVGRVLEGVELRSGEGSALEFRSRWGAVAIATAEGLRRIAPGEWLPTGDLGEEDVAGRWRLLGRNSELLKRFGEKISLALLLETVRGAWQGDAAFYIDDSGPGETEHVLVLCPQPDMAQVRSILQAFRVRHRRPHWPVRIETRADMPLLPNGKPDARVLAQRLGHTVAWRQIS